MAQIARETAPSFALTLLRPETTSRQASAEACTQVGSWFAPLRFANVIIALGATSAFVAGFVLRTVDAQSNRMSIGQEAYKVATAGARKCGSSATVAVQLGEKGVMSPSVFSLASATNGERGACRVLRARDATDYDCSMLVTVGSGGYFRLLYSGLYYVTVQVTVEAEAKSGCIELIVARRRPGNGKMADKRGSKKVDHDGGQSCLDKADGDASTEITLSAAKATLPCGSAADPAAKANTTMYTSKLAALRSGDEISLRLRCFSDGTGGTANGESDGGCRLSVDRGSLLGLVPVELSSN